ncbi:MlaD family protein [Tautonia plasticadhaerens]|uniref:OmpA family protein n=1 Tax=Tautonia plasticadhaerens TaxID=2527974 RepID=A0A518GVK8_9BACT|nr:MlaD family protein [Tautonia plasticadhaerens]QDV32632.1 OmpA family protein [Tautonia plasticadhaerens]
MRREIGPIRALASGVFCLGILGLAGFGAVQVASKNWQVQDTYRLLAEFESVAGLEPGGRVFVQGVDAGVVEGIEPPDEPGRPVRLVLRVDARLRPLIRTDAEARIVTQGVVGARVVEISPGSPGAEVLPEGGLVRSVPPIELADLMREATDALARVDAVADEAERGLAEVNAIASSIRGGEGTIGRLLTDDEPVDRLVSLTDRGERTLTDLQDNLDAIKNTWPISRYFTRRGYDDRELALYRPNSDRYAMTLSESDLFEPGRAMLTEPGRGRLDEVAKWTKEHLTKQTDVIVAAYTDGALDDLLAERLTQQQAEAVRRYLVDSHGLDSAGWFRSRTVAAVGFGRHRPQIPSADPQSGGPDRRVEIILFTPQA